MTKLCIFDLDGTVLNTLTTIAYYGNNALSAYGIQPIDEEDYKLLIGKGIVNLIKNMLNFRGCMSEENFEKVFRHYDTAYNANTSYLTTPYAGIPEMLTAIKEKGISMAVVSNKPHFATTGVVNAIFGENYFDLVYGQRDGVPIKPDPTAVIEVMEHFGVTPEECLYVGDTGTDMKTGKNANIYTLGVLWGFRGKEELVQNGADAVIEHPGQLLEYLR